MAEPRLEMKDLPMLDVDRERLRGEFEGFDNMTLEEFRAAYQDKINEMLDLFNALGESSPE